MARRPRPEDTNDRSGQRCHLRRRARGPRRDGAGRARRARRGQRARARRRGDRAHRTTSNPQLNAVIHERFERARDEADVAPPAGPLHGVPFLVKDAVCHTAGDPFHCGMRALKAASWTEPDDTWLAARFRAAGFVFVGKTNTPELATSCTTEPLAYGATHNPWDLDAQHRRVERRLGGRGGRRAGAGRARQRHGRLDPVPRVDVRHRRAEADPRPHDARARLRRVLGPAHARVRAHAHRSATPPRCSTRSRAPAPATRTPRRHRCARTVEEVGAPVERLRIGFRTRPAQRRQPSHPDCVAAVEATAQPARSARPPRRRRPTLAALDAPIDHAFGIVMRVAIARDVARWSARLGRDITAELEPTNAMIAGCVRRRSPPRSTSTRSTTCRRGRARCRRGGTTPTCSCCRRVPSRRSGSASSRPTTSEDLGRMADARRRSRRPFDLTGQPAISLPLHWNADGLPIGVQLVARYGREDVLLRAGRAARGRASVGRPPPTRVRLSRSRGALS